MQPIQRDSVKEAKRLGYKCIKNSTDLEVGLPDYSFFGWNGHHFFVEFKRPGEPLRPAQKRRVRKFAEMGHEIYVIDNVDDFYRIPKKGQEPARVVV